MLHLVYDTETTGLVNNRETHTHPSQPHLVQLGCVLITEEGHELASVDLIVKPDGWTIPTEAARVHGITTEIALSCGVPLVVAVAVFTNLRARAHALVAHNIDFDERVMAAAIHRTGRSPASPGPEQRFCTKELASPVLNLPPTARMISAGFNKPKPPTLGECYQYLFGEELVDAHSALIDCRACARVFLELKRRELEAAA